MTVGVIIPVGPGHEDCAAAATASVRAAWQVDPGPFTALAIRPVLDPTGTLGASGARNRGMDDTATDWHFLLDADDVMLPQAFGLVEPSAAATFGAICLDGRIPKWNRHPITRASLFDYGARGTLTMGCFVRGDLGLRFDETLRNGEDMDFYLRLPSFVKRADPLVSISYFRRTVARAVAPESAGWLEACDEVVRRYSLEA